MNPLIIECILITHAAGYNYQRAKLDIPSRFHGSCKRLPKTDNKNGEQVITMITSRKFRENLLQPFHAGWPDEKNFAQSADHVAP